MFAKKSCDEGHNMKNKKYTKEFLREVYEEMLFLRRFEERAAQQYGMGKIGGFCHLYIGQEAVAIGVQRALKKGDAVITSYRDHGQMLATGSDPNTIMAELLGKMTGCSKGKGGSMHMFDVPNHFYGGHGIVGAQVPIGAGIAFAYKYREQNNISVVYFGDGAANQGQVYETFNMAKLWDLPVLFIIENNRYAMGTSVARSSGNTDLHMRGASIGIPGKQVDGMDFFAVYQATLEAAEYIRSGQGPFLLEMQTYRYRGHSMSDPGKYRTKDEVQEVKEKHDPLDRIAKVMTDQKAADSAYFEALEENIAARVKASIDFAESSPEPSEDELYTDIYID